MPKDINKLIPIKKAVFDYRKGIILRTYYISPEKYLRELLKLRSKVQPSYLKLSNNLKIAIYNNDIFNIKKELRLTEKEFNFLSTALFTSKRQKQINNFTITNNTNLTSLDVFKRFQDFNKTQFTQNILTSWFNYLLTNEINKFVKDSEINLRTKFLKPLSESVILYPKLKTKTIKYKFKVSNKRKTKKKRVLEQVQDLETIYREVKIRKNKDNSQIPILSDEFVSITLTPQKIQNPYITGKLLSKVINYLNLSDGKFLDFLYSFIPQTKEIEDNKKHILKNMFFPYYYYKKDKQFYSHLISKVLLDTLEFYVNDILLSENNNEFEDKYITDFYNTFFHFLILSEIDKIRFTELTNDLVLNRYFTDILKDIYELVSLKEKYKKFNNEKEFADFLLKVLDKLNTIKLKLINLFKNNCRQCISDFLNYVNLYNVLPFLISDITLLKQFGVLIKSNSVLKFIINNLDEETIRILQKGVILNNVKDKNDLLNDYFDYLVWINTIRDIPIYNEVFLLLYEDYKDKLIEIVKDVDVNELKEINPLYVFIQYSLSNYLNRIPEFNYEKNIIFRLAPVFNPYVSYAIVRTLKDFAKNFSYHILEILNKKYNLDLDELKENYKNLYIVIYRERLSILNYFEFITDKELKNYEFIQQNVRIFRFKDIVNKLYDGNIENIKGIWRNLILFFNLV